MSSVSIEGTIEAIAQQLIKSGPNRVIVNADGEGKRPARALAENKVQSDIIFIRNDGWTLGAPKSLEHVAFEMWDDHWIGYMRVPEHIARRMNEYPK